MQYLYGKGTIRFKATQYNVSQKFTNRLWPRHFWPFFWQRLTREKKSRRKEDTTQRVVPSCRASTSYLDATLGLPDSLSRHTAA